MTQEEKDQVTLHVEAIMEIYKKERETNPDGHACCLLLTDNDEKQILDMTRTDLDIMFLMSNFSDAINFRNVIMACAAGFALKSKIMGNHEKA